MGTFLVGIGHHIPRHLERKPRGTGVSSTLLGSPLSYQSLPSMRAQPRPSDLAEVEMPQATCMEMQEHPPVSPSCHRPLPGAHTRLHHPPLTSGRPLAQFQSFLRWPTATPLASHHPVPGAFQGCLEQSRRLRRGTTDSSANAVPGCTFAQFVQKLGESGGSCRPHLLLGCKLLGAGAAPHGAS